ncbi:uncharacterized protein B0I36DRAFT_412362, partial [Microdochium trichocladiopsis]
PSLTGNTVWLSGDDSDGFDVVLSDDSRAKVRGVLEACGSLDNQCFQDVQQVLAQSDLQIDPQLNKRDFFALLSKTFRLASSRVAATAAILMAFWQAKYADEQFAQAFVPRPVAEAAGAFAIPGAEVVVELQGSPLVTVTAPTPAATTLIGPSQPSVTAVASPGNGLELGDLVACMDIGLAARIDEVMHRAKECKDGQDFDATESPSRLGGSYGSAICGGEAVVAMAQPGGAFNDLLLINPTSITFSFAAAAGPVARASRVLSEFVLAYAPTLDITPEAAEMMANYVFALAVRTLIDNVSLAAENPIKSDLVDETPRDCPDINTDPVSAFPLTQAQPAHTDASITSAVIKGKYERCPCLGSAYPFEHVLSPEEVADMVYLADLLAQSEPAPAEPACDNENMTELPASVFLSASNNVYHHFCENWSPSSGEMRMDVNAAGDNILPEPHTRIQRGDRYPYARAPPPDPSIWSDYTFSLSYKPSKGGGSCSADCTAAFEKVGTACRQQGGMSRPWSSRVFRLPPLFEVAEPVSTPLALGERECFPREADPAHGVVVEGYVFGNAWVACYDAVVGASRTMSAGDPPRTTLLNSEGTGYFYSISWEEDCVLDNGQTSQPVDDPLGVGTDTATWTCTQLLMDDWKLCDNGAAGGKIRAGCLVYEFKPMSAS